MVDSIEVARSDDPERTEINEMLSAWADVLGVGRRYRHTLAEIIKVVGNQTFNVPTWPRLNSAIQAAAARGREPANARRLGLWLRSRKGRFVGRYRFMNDIEHGGGDLTNWWVESADKKETEGRWGGFQDED